MAGRGGAIYRRDEPIATPRQGLDKAWTLRRVAQRLANLGNGGIQIVVDIDEGVGPELLLQFLTSHHLTGVFQQKCQDLKRLTTELQFHARLAQLPSPQVNLEIPKTYVVDLRLYLCHAVVLAVSSYTPMFPGLRQNTGSLDAAIS